MTIPGAALDHRIRSMQVVLFVLSPYQAHWGTRDIDGAVHHSIRDPSSIFQKREAHDGRSITYFLRWLVRNGGSSILY